MSLFTTILVSTFFFFDIGHRRKERRKKKKKKKRQHFFFRIKRNETIVNTSTDRHSLPIKFAQTLLDYLNQTLSKFYTSHPFTTLLTFFFLPTSQYSIFTFLFLSSSSSSFQHCFKRSKHISIQRATSSLVRSVVMVVLNGLSAVN